MGRKILKAVILFALTVCFVLTIPVYAQKKLLDVTYPPNNYRTRADKVFFIGTATGKGDVTIDGKKVDRSHSGNFAPTLPLKEGDNEFRIRYQNEEIKLKIIREPLVATALVNGQEEGTKPQDKVSPSTGGDSVCFGAARPPINLSGAFGNTANLSANNEPQAIFGAGQYLGCAVAKATGNVGQPSGSLQSSAQPAALIEKKLEVAKVETRAMADLEVAEIITDNAVTRTGPSSNYNRVTPLPKGTKATVLGRQDGDNNGKIASFVHLDYGGWVNAADLKTTTGLAVPPQATVQSVRNQRRGGHTDVVFPLQVAVPIVIDQQEKSLKLTLYNTTAKMSAIGINGDPMIERVDFKSLPPNQVEYTFSFKSRQQWGYSYRYDGTNLILSLRHPPQRQTGSSQPLTGMKILLDPGHGGMDSGAIGYNGYAEKEATLFAAKLLGNELVAKGAKVYLTREVDKEVSLDARRAMVHDLEPTVSLSIHYNSLPDGAEPAKIKGFSTYWYHPQAQGLANFLHSYVTQYGGRPQYGVTWNNLALARPAEAPSVLLELGFMSNPEEFEWITNPQAQQEMAKTLANGLSQWLMTMN
jgi:N-acetylmuramoyl-L-alanine amidase